MTFEEFLAQQKSQPQPKRIRHIEHDMQVACVEWFNTIFPVLRGLLFAVPNGAMLNGTVAQRRLAGARLRDEGMIAGVADLLLLVPRGKYHGLCIELKTKSGVQSDAQKRWQQLVESQGYKYIIVKPTKEHTGVENFNIAVSRYLMT